MKRSEQIIKSDSTDTSVKGLVTQSTAKKPSLAELRKKIEKQVGFPSELKVAKIILDSGWTYTSNPFVEVDGKEIELDLIARASNESPSLRETFKDGYISINLIIDVKKFSRPLIVFSSDWTVRDMIDTYADFFILNKKGRVKSDFALLGGLVDKLGLDLAGRSAVVMNDEGDRPKDYDIHQISSAVRTIHQGCIAVQKEAMEMAEFNNRYSNESDGSVYLDVSIPVIVYDGSVFEYYITDRGHRLRRSKLTTISRTSVGFSDRMRSCPVYVCDLSHFREFISEIDAWKNGIKFEDIAYRVEQYRK